MTLKPIIRTFTLLISLALLAALFLPTAGIFAQDEPVDKGLSIDIPTLLAPSGPIDTRQPIYSWTRVFAATQYRYQVWQGSTLVMEKSPESKVCGQTTCERQPEQTLSYGSYKWRVQAYVHGVWKPYADYFTFSITPPSFSSNFNSSMSGWKARSGGTWSTTSPTAIFTTGLNDNWTSAYQPLGQYSDFDYSVRMKRTGGIYGGTWYPGSCLSVRMGSSVNPANAAWYPGLVFCYQNNQYFSIWEYDSTGAVSAVQPWVFSDLVLANDWNVLRVVALGNTMQFYINGNLMYSYTEPLRLKGFVGVQMYKRSGGTSTKLQVDWAILSVEPTLTATPLQPLVDPTILEPIAIGGIPNDSPEGGTSE